MSRSKPPSACVRCGLPVMVHKYTWFSHEVVAQTTPRPLKAQVFFKVEVRQPTHGKLCLRCTGEVIAQGSAAIHAKLVELNAMVVHQPPPRKPK